MSVNAISDKIFSITSKADFEKICMEVFRFQCEHNPTYHNYVKAVGLDSITKPADIPFLPISFFKTHEISCETGQYDEVFYSSTTSSNVPSRHFVKDIKMYEESFRKGFTHFYGDVKDYCVLALLPSYLERKGSSLVYMAEDLIKNSRNDQSGFYIHDYSKLIKVLNELERKGQKVLLLGVTYALLKLAEEFPIELKNTIVMETGGMKGKREELPKHEVHNILKKAFGINTVHSEYGMTELLSQTYSKGDGLFQCPAWMKVAIRDIYDPFQVDMQKGSGAINIIDLANINSCAFIATDDLGVLHANGDFEVSGRIDYSDIRGCNLMAEEL